MADELKIALDPFTQTGLTLLGKVYAATGAQEGATVSMTEDGPAVYIGDFSVAAVADGEYLVRFETNTPDKLYGTGTLYVRNNSEVTPEVYAQTGDAMTLENNSITSSVVATDALDNSAFTTGFYNSINAEVDTALADYDAPTKAELDTAKASIIAEVDANETKIDALPTLASMNNLGVNIQQVNGYDVDGTGQPGTEWGPA